MAREGHERLLERLRQVGPARVPLDDILACFHVVHPELRNEPDAPRLLLQYLKTLDAEARVRTPQGKRHWTPSPGTQLPRWVVLPRSSETPARSLDAASYSWVPKLAFAASLRRRSEIETARAINDYLIARPSNAIGVPTRERSLEVFGDEKRLDTLADAAGNLFAGRLHLSDLDCYAVAAPIPHQTFPKARGSAVLVVENHHTYWSLVRANEQHLRYAAVCYGGGNRWTRASAAGEGGSDSDLDRILRECASEKLCYFGDVDPAGLEIPYRVNRMRCEAELPEVIPERTLYAWLIRHGRRVDARETPARDRLTQLRALAVEWLGMDLGTGAADLIEHDQRLPQEGLSYPHICEWRQEWAGG